MTTNGSSFFTRFSRSFGAVWGIVASAAQTRSLASVQLVMVSLTVTSFLLGVRQLGWIQPLELAAFDKMIRLRPSEGPDPRLLVVAITEADIKAQKQYPISDRVLAQVLEELSRLKPRVIGLDLARNIPQEPGHAELQRSFQKDQVIAVTSIDNTGKENISPPPGIPPERVGFSDIVLDPDNVIRRNLMYATGGTSTLHSFSLRLALAYLAAEGISPELTKDNYLKFGKTVFGWLQSNSGGYQNIDDGDYQILLNYRSAHNVARQVTLTQVLSKQIDPSLVKDKIVLIGTTAASVRDVFNTPYSATERENPQMAGVLIHAQMVSQILSAVKNGRPLFWYWPEWLEVLWIAGWGLVGGLVAIRAENFFILGLSGVGSLGVLFGSSFVLFLHAGWVPVAAPAIALILASGSVVAYQLQQARGQHEMVMKLLGQQTSPKIAAALWNNRDRLLTRGILPGQKLTATILITDLRGFSTISEVMPPETVMVWLNEYLAVMTQLVNSHEGIINKFTGDGLMAVFGVPVPSTTEEEIAKDAIRAVACALAMGERLQELNRGWSDPRSGFFRDRGLPELQMRVGIFTGPVMVGSLGGKERLEYGVIGDTVNIASRLESCEKDRQPSTCRVLIAHETLVYVKEHFQVESWGSLALKGRQQPVDVYSVIGHLPNEQVGVINHLLSKSGMAVGNGKDL